MDQATVSLIRKAQSGDSEAFQRLVAQYDSQVMSVALRLLRDERDAEDIYQEVFMKVFMNIRNFRFESDFFTWLYKITVNTSFNFSKRMAKHYRVQKEDEYEGGTLDWIPDPQTPEADESDDVQMAVMAAVGKLPQKQRTVFILKHLENLKIKDIAALLNCGEGTVKKYLFRALEKLRFELKDYRYA